MFFSVKFNIHFSADINEMLNSEFYGDLGESVVRHILCNLYNFLSIVYVVTFSSHTPILIERSR